MVTYLVFMAGTIFGIVIVSLLSTNSREEERNEAYTLGYKDGANKRPPRVQMR